METKQLLGIMTAIIFTKMPHNTDMDMQLSIALARKMYGAIDHKQCNK